MHAMAGTPRAITPHTRWEINDGELFLSEASMAAAIAGELGVPTVMVSGDDKVTAEVRGRIPHIEVAVVKEALSPYQACSLTPAGARELIAAAAARGIARRGSIAPFLIPGPVRLVLVDADGRKEGEPVGGETVGEAFLEYLKARPWAPLNTVLPNGYRYP